MMINKAIILVGIQVLVVAFLLGLAVGIGL